MKKLTNNKTLYSSLLGVMLISSLGTAHVVHANAVDEAADACIEAARLITENDDLDGAIEEASWCLTGLKQLKEEIKLSLLPDELNGYVGGDIKNENVLGMVTVERIYTQDGDSLSVTLLTSGGAAGGALAGLGELAKVFGGLEMGGAVAAGGKKIRIQRRTVVVSDEAENGGAALTVQLKSGGTLQVASVDLDSDELIEFMREFPIIEIDEATAE